MITCDTKSVVVSPLSCRCDIECVPALVNILVPVVDPLSVQQHCDLHVWKVLGLLDDVVDIGLEAPVRSLDRQPWLPENLQLSRLQSLLVVVTFQAVTNIVRNLPSSEVRT